MSSPPINPLDNIIKTPPSSSKTKKRMRSPSRTPLQSPLQTGNPNPFTIKNVLSFPSLPFNRDNDPNVIIGNSIDGLGMTTEEVEGLSISIGKQEEQARKKRRSELRKQNTSKESRERARIRSKKYRENKKKLKELQKKEQKKSGGKRTRKQIKKHKKSRQSKKA